MLKKLAAISLAVGALVLAAPSVASAAPTESVSIDSDTYATPPGVTIGEPIITQCTVSTIAFGAGYFLPSETVSVSVSGHNAAAAIVSGNTAAADGSLLVTFRPPADGEGAYAITFASSRASGEAGVGARSSAEASTTLGPLSYTATITVSKGRGAGAGCKQDPTVAAAGTELPLTGGGIELALTGGDISPWVIGGGAAALAAGGALLVAGAAKRKRS